MIKTRLSTTDLQYLGIIFRNFGVEDSFIEDPNRCLTSLLATLADFTPSEDPSPGSQENATELLKRGTGASLP